MEDVKRRVRRAAQFQEGLGDPRDVEIARLRDTVASLAANNVGLVRELHALETLLRAAQNPKAS